jgi:hypothetical protein
MHVKIQIVTSKTFLISILKKTLVCLSNILNYLKSLIKIVRIRPRTPLKYGSSGYGFGSATQISKEIFFIKKEEKTKNSQIPRVYFTFTNSSKDTFIQNQ